MHQIEAFAVLLHDPPTKGVLGALALPSGLYTKTLGHPGKVTNLNCFNLVSKLVYITMSVGVC